MKMYDEKNKNPNLYRNLYKQSGTKTTILYETPDLYLAAFLKAKGTILKNSKKEKGRITFIFQDKGNIQDLIKDYFNDSNVAVLTFKAALRDLRSIIFDYKNSFFPED